MALCNRFTVSVCSFVTYGVLRYLASVTMRKNFRDLAPIFQRKRYSACSFEPGVYFPR